MSGDLPHGITPRYPLARFETKEFADHAAAALQERVAELSRATYAKRQWSNVDRLLAEANPHFVVVAEKELSRPELSTAREKIRWAATAHFA